MTALKSCDRCGKPLQCFLEGWRHTQYAKRGEVCLHPSPALRVIECYSCLAPLTPGEAREVQESGFTVTACVGCASLEPFSVGSKR